MIRIKRAKVSASKFRLTSIRRPSASTTSKAHVSGPLPSPLVPATLTSTDGLPSLGPHTSLRRLLSPRCKVLNAKPCLWQNSLGRSPLDSNSTTSWLISRRLRRFPTLTPSRSVTPTVHQKHARSTRWVRLTDTVYCIALFSVCSPRRAKIPIIYPDFRLDYKVATHPRSPW